MTYQTPARRLWRIPIRGLHTLDWILRRQQTRLSLRRVLLVVLVCGPLYGMAMGSYASVSGHRSVVQQIPQMVYSAIKVPLLIGVTVLLSTPIFYVINALSGLASDFRSALHAIVSAQAGLTIILSSLMPITLFMYLSVSHHPVGYQLAILFNAAMFGLASITAQRLLWSYYRPLIRADDRHAVMVQMWIFVYAFVGIQAAYVLRPFIGSPNMKTTFIREESFENAYVRIIELVADVWKQMF